MMDVCTKQHLANIWSSIHEKVNPSRPNPGRREKIKFNFCIHIAFEAPQRSVKIEI